MPNEFTYETAGFDSYLSRPLVIASGGIGVSLPSRQLNYDQSQVSGALGDILQLGSVRIDGRNGRISILDSQGREQATMGAGRIEVLSPAGSGGIVIENGSIVVSDATTKRVILGYQLGGF